MIWPSDFQLNMFQINLLSKKRGIQKRRNYVSLGTLVVFVVVTLYFLTQVVMVIARTVVVNRNMRKVNSETRSLSAQLLRDNEKLAQFVLTKAILGEISKLRAGQFDYSAYLSQIQSLIPVGSSIAGVDFQMTGIVSVRLLSGNIGYFSDLEKAIRSADLTQTSFDSVTVLSVARDKDGRYRTDVLFGIKKNKS